MTSDAKTPDEYVASLAPKRKAALSKLRSVILKNIPIGFKEGIAYGMLGYAVPHSLYPDGYHCDPKTPLPFMSIASQKNYVAVYHSGIYAKKELHDWFVGEYPKYSKRKLDMGKSCIRFKHIDEIPYELIGELAKKMTPKQWIEIYEKAIKNRKN